jgi:hypothetical protein
MVKWNNKYKDEKVTKTAYQNYRNSLSYQWRKVDEVFLLIPQAVNEGCSWNYPPS